MTKKEAKERIETIEFYGNGFHKLSGYDVRAINIRLRKEKVIADIIFYEDGVRERHDNCEYPIEVLERIKI